MTNDNSETKPRLQIARTFRTSPEKLWRAWTDPALMLRWLGPVDWPAFEMAADLRVGGLWSAALKSESGEILRQSGRYLAIEAPEFLRFTFKWDGDNHEDGPGVETIVEVRISATAEGASMHFTHEGLVSADSQSGHESGWNSTFDRLADFLAA
jgi:uncharacterized protein YndB with AHSA1/START domain